MCWPMAAFLAAIDKKSPDYARLSTYVTQLLQQGAVSSSVEFLKDEGSETRRTVQLDWYLEIHTSGPLAQRPRIGGRIDVVANNAGIPLGGSLDTNTVAEIERCLDINLKGVLFGAQASLPHLKKTAPAELLRDLASREAFGRAAEVWEIANVMVFLASDYSSYLVGEVISASSQRS